MIMRPSEPHGARAVGRIVKLLVGQGCGFIRLPDDREIYFHRADVREGTSFNDLRVGDSVVFELLDDRISGARALKVRPRRSR
jgi:cold shock CspA family protein